MTLPSPNTPTPPHPLPFPHPVPELSWVTAVLFILFLMWRLIIGNCHEKKRSVQEKKSIEKKIQHFSVDALKMLLIYLFVCVYACRHDVIESERKLLPRSITGQQPSETHRRTQERWSRLLKQTQESLSSNPLSGSYTWAMVGWFDSDGAHRFTNLQFPRLL